MNPVLLHGYWRSSATWRLRIALNLKQIRYETKIVNTGNKDNLTAEYIKLNPAMKIPTLEIDGHVLTETLPTCEYLDELYPN